LSFPQKRESRGNSSRACSISDIGNPDIICTNPHKILSLIKSWIPVYTGMTSRCSFSRKYSNFPIIFQAIATISQGNVKVTFSGHSCESSPVSSTGQNLLKILDSLRLRRMRGNDRRGISSAILWTLTRSCTISPQMISSLPKPVTELNECSSNSYKRLFNNKEGFKVSF